MYTRFNFDRELAKGFVILFLMCLFVVIGSSLLVGRFLDTIIVPIIFGILIFLIWTGFAHGTYIVIKGVELTVSRVFFKGKPTSLLEVVSINKRTMFGGLLAEVYMKVRRPDGTFREQGLINKPGLKESEYKRLFDIILSINPNIQIDQDLL